MVLFRPILKFGKMRIIIKICKTNEYAKLYDKSINPLYSTFSASKAM